MGIRKMKEVKEFFKSLITNIAEAAELIALAILVIILIFHFGLGWVNFSWDFFEPIIVLGILGLSLIFQLGDYYYKNKRTKK